VVLKFIPDGIALIAKLAIAPPVELMVKPVADVLTVLVSAADVRVKAGAAIGAAVVVDAGGTYAGVVTGIEEIDTGEVPSAVVAETVKVYLVKACRVLIARLKSFQ
jgi:hypothetical protein